MHILEICNGCLSMFTQLACYIRMPMSSTISVHLAFGQNGIEKKNVESIERYEVL